MKVIDFHPDELFDREIKGTLTGDERRRLVEHMERCSQCRLEHQLRIDFAEELQTGEDAPNIQSFVTGALRAASVRPSGRVPRAAGSSAWRRRFVFLLAATMVLATGIAAANGERAWIAAREKIAFVFRLPPRERSAPKSAILAPSIDKATPAAENGAAPAALAPLDAPGAAPSAPAAAPNALSNAATGPAANVIAPIPELARLEARPARTSAPAHRAATVPAKVEAQAQAPEAPAKADVSPIPVPSANPRPRDSAAILFDDANAARRRGNTVEAASLYRDLQARFPASAEARLSIAVVARMQLDAGETAAAASGFSAYLATGDRALREEAMAGRAMAFGRLGRAREEADAWRELLRAYPRSGYAGLAKTRMGQDPSR